MTLYLKYRPISLDKVIGNHDVLASLAATISKDDPPHSYLFHGITGCGKTTLARIAAKELGCVGNDFREIDSADFRGIDTIRDIRRQSGFRPLEGTSRAFLLDECHQLSSDAQNALLKALEDTPPHVFYFLCTTNPLKLLDTIKGRCVQFQVKLLNDLQMKKLLRDVVNAEEDNLDKEVYNQIILDSQGRPRAALQILEKVLSVQSDKQRLKIARQAAEQQSKTIELCRAMLNGSPWSKVAHILKGLESEDPEQIRRAVMGYCATTLVSGENDRAGLVMDEFRDPFYDSGFPGLVHSCYAVICGE